MMNNERTMTEPSPFHQEILSSTHLDRFAIHSIREKRTILQSLKTVPKGNETVLDNNYK